MKKNTKHKTKMKRTSARKRRTSRLAALSLAGILSACGTNDARNNGGRNEAQSSCGLNVPVEISTLAAPGRHFAGDLLADEIDVTIASDNLLTLENDTYQLIGKMKTTCVDVRNQQSVTFESGDLATEDIIISDEGTPVSSNSLTITQKFEDLIANGPAEANNDNDYLELPDVFALRDCEVAFSGEFIKVNAFCPGQAVELQIDNATYSFDPLELNTPAAGSTYIEDVDAYVSGKGYDSSENWYQLLKMEPASSGGAGGWTPVSTVNGDIQANSGKPIVINAIGETSDFTSVIFQDKTNHSSVNDTNIDGGGRAAKFLNIGNLPVGMYRLQMIGTVFFGTATVDEQEEDVEHRAYYTLPDDYPLGTNGGTAPGRVPDVRIADDYGIEFSVVAPAAIVHEVSHDFSQAITLTAQDVAEQDFPGDLASVKFSLVADTITPVSPPFHTEISTDGSTLTITSNAIESVPTAVLDYIEMVDASNVTATLTINITNTQVQGSTILIPFAVGGTREAHSLKAAASGNINAASASNSEGTL